MDEPTSGTGGISQSDIDNLLKEVEQGEKAERQSSPAAGAEPKAGDRVPKEETLAAEPRKAPKPRPGANGSSDIDFLMDIPLHVSVEVGRTRMTIADLLSMGPGSIVELDKLAGEPLDIFINEKLIARGEAIIINEKFGVRLTDVVSKVERIENLKA